MTAKRIRSRSRTTDSSADRHSLSELAEVGLDHVGLVLGIEMSRLARSNEDWRQLVELCALFHCLLVDQDGLYDPTNYNDRLLLGLRGMMSEAELHILKNEGSEPVLLPARSSSCRRFWSTVLRKSPSKMSNCGPLQAAVANIVR